jgi:Transposase IS66 family
MSRGQLTIESRLRQQVTILTKANIALKSRTKELEQENKDLKKTITDLQYQIKQLQDIVYGKKNFPTISPDFKYGELITHDKKIRPTSSYIKPIPDDSEITQIVNTRAPQGYRTRLRTFYVIDIPEIQPKTVTKHIVEQYFKNGVWVSDIVIPDSNVIFGSNIKNHIVIFRSDLNMSYTQIKNHVKALWDISISEGCIHDIITKKAQSYYGLFETIKEETRLSPYTHIDESSWHVGNDNYFVWVMVGTARIPVYITGVTRGKGNAIDLLGNNYPGVLITDDYAVYKYLTDKHQLCWAHLIRKWRDMTSITGTGKRIIARITKEYSELKQLYTEVKEVLVTKNPLSMKEDFVCRLKQVAHIHPTDPIPFKRVKTTLLKNIESRLLHHFLQHSKTPY